MRRFDSLLAAVFVGALALTIGGGARAWTTTKLSGVDVTVSVAPRGPSEVRTQARFEVQGGKFHGFAVAPLPGAELVATECRAVTDDGRAMPLVLRPTTDGRMRILFAADASLDSGAVTFTLVHRVDLAAGGALRLEGRRARLDWTPLAWDAGTDAMTVDILLPGEGAFAPEAVPAVSEDYEVSATPGGVRMTKYRTVRWYSMRVAVDFDPSLVPVLGLTAPRSSSGAAPPSEGAFDPEVAAAAGTSVEAPKPSLRDGCIAPLVAILVGLLLGLWKCSRTRRTYGDLGMTARFLVGARLGFGARAIAVAAASLLGFAVQATISVAAGIPAIAAAVGLLVLCRDRRVPTARAGGVWREMGDIDFARFAASSRAYRKRRTSFVDITTPQGFAAFGAVAFGLGALCVSTYASAPGMALAALLDGALWIVPAWFTQTRDELPADPTFESFLALRRSKRSLRRLVGARLRGAIPVFFVREDDEGAIEVRLRIRGQLPEGLREIEVANELVRRGRRLESRFACILRLEPGKELSRKLASCPNAAEHHLTPDLAEEIVVLRNRRGPVSRNLAPLRTALAKIAG